MAEEVTKEAAPGRVMTAEEAMAYEREIQLGNPSEVRMPDGRTLEEFQKGEALRQRGEAEESARREDEGIRRETSAVLPDVYITTTDAGGVVSAPVQTIEEAVEERKKERGEAETSTAPTTAPEGATEANAEPTAPTIRTKRKASEPVPAAPPLPAESPAE